MTLSILLALCLIDLSFGGTTCGDSKSGVPTLEIKTADISGANYGGVLLATIRSNDEWSDWRKLDNVGCDDFERGSVDYFDDFEDITDEWQAIVIYNCDTDGIAISGISYWDGQSNANYIDYFCDNVGAIGYNCYGGAVTNGAGTCYKGIDDDYYERVWVDQDDTSCPAINVAFGGTLVKNKKTNVGKVYFKSNPGIPTCSNFKEQSYIDQLFAVLPSNPSKTIFAESESYAMLMVILIGIAVIYAVIKCIKNKRYNGYEKSIDTESKYGTLNV